MKTDLVVAGYLIHSGKVLLIKHKKLGLWLPVGGHIEADETPDDALKREFLEEVGLDIEIVGRPVLPPEGNVIRSLANPFYVNVHKVKDHDHCCFFYICRCAKPSIRLNTEEVTEHIWLGKDELGHQGLTDDVRNIAIKAFEAYEKHSKE